MRETRLVDFGNYLYAQGRDLVEDSVESHLLFDDESLTAILAGLRERLRRDVTDLTPEALESSVASGIRSFAGDWFQRIEFPQHGLSTASDRSWCVYDEGGVNTLGLNLTSDESCRLRPWPKWLYIKPLLPILNGKTVLEIGSCNGFFPFRFAELGASQVTGLEMQKRKHESAVWANSVLGWKNVHFRHTDFLVDFTIAPHDVVFASEVVNHLLCPLWGLSRMVGLAKELLILDTGAFDSPRHGIELSSGWEPDGKSLLFLSFHLSDGLICSYLKLLGLRSEEIIKYAEAGAGHILYRINTKPLHERRARGEVPEVLRRSLLAELTLPAPTKPGHAVVVP